MVPRLYAPPMRTAYQEQLDKLTDELARMCTVAAAALDDATRALGECDLHLAQQVIAGHAAVDAARAAGPRW